MADSGSEIVGGDLLSVVKDDCSLTEAISKEGGLTAGSSAAKEIHEAEPLDHEDSTKDPSVKTPVMEAEGFEGYRETSLTPTTTCAAMSENGTTEDARSTLQSQTLTEGNGESSVATFGRSDEYSQSATTDSASFSIPSLEFFEGNDEPLSSYSALGIEGSSLSADVPCLADDVLVGVAAAAATGGAAPDLEPMMPAYYFVKWITWKEKKTPIITQSENGPCPLLAIMNTLFLRWKAKLPAQTEVITTEDLMAHLGECVLSIKPREKAEGMELNFQQNMSDAMAVLPKLSTGLDVNVRFTGVSDFEYTPECIAFDLLDIPLYHGWLVDPQSPEMVAAVGKLSYNQLVEKIIDYKHSANSSRVSEGLVAEQFLESTATQLSYHGLCELNTTVKEGELSVFFRNNHFSTMIKHKGHLYLLVTDQGFLQEGGLVWESLHNVEGDGNFCDSDFRLCHPPQRSVPVTQPEDLTPQQQQRQIDQDYLVAMSLQQQQGVAPGPLSDLDLARQLQEEEYQQQQQQQQQGGPSQAPAQQVRGQAAAQPGGSRRREKKDDSDCAIL
ncbi:ubiquitin carboxyl-terminal hydrolase MINDY-1-like isoform X1 [Salvelinus fontinalis]|uniref:ubiquitin carboxyl-terminal hydrolase MINDY-1-like isoform X1 n=2 Tax=Salvelinus fontinalis TaxID=8038 RepID=UPI002485BE77|nr:ubiquitin carboxyl-terminal hydrolase MINDY-1-like isoform X1 [Salvelinus fontinalis]XP_055750257.1 ubiquitin carboxyl-terminal hydrolase MINDY-1-like isoform X1 [Salvelinus fontinalis]XP_055750258.1 ubiquitin carboxyl-terminal hydrolase MINDY-1-like isoform X1 [Salvelinus fontinalis]XP_055750259.1 ubiquitin carboxyl-terminal hydrolase MINDY-1-like isoform X1 [Salvelinus fontinalis]XP_055750261.1 ubiquitin carboxyl-terminal hydrolase MINDY-1-like isoform X1 [Salvelinus fontinalis]